jgi:tetraacyldisaccharide 4'-kinase
VAAAETAGAAERPALAAPPPPRSPWQLLYGAVHRLRRARAAGRAERLPRPVVSIGNLHWGGGGKTPLAAAVAARLRDGGRRVCVLSRGYGGGGRGVRLVSDGGGPLLAPGEAGDEPVLLARELPGVAVVVAAERAAAGRFALRTLSPAPELFILDDGFSHVALARDLDLLAFPAADPFAGGRLAPSGRLREPLASARWADAVLLTGLAPEEVAAGGAGDRLAAALAPHGFRGPGFACALAVGEPRLAGGAALAPATPVLLVSAIARPERFAASARRAGLAAAGELAFRDHHDYPPASLRRIAAAARAAGAEAVLTTAKDAVKLRGRLDLPLAELPVRAEPEPAFWSWLEGRLAEVGASAPDRRAGGEGER